MVDNADSPTLREIVDRERAFYDRLHSKRKTQLPRFEGVLTIPGVETLDGKTILICSCGTSDEQVRAARAGAEVFTFDISSAAVEKAKEIADFNEIRINAEVMDFHRLNYPDNFFDVAFGQSILHHVDCELAGRELHRCLKPGAVAVFWENSDRNPLIRWFRRKAFGVPGGRAKQQFLFFKRIGTPDEYPLTDEEIAALGKIFKGQVRVFHEYFSFFRLLYHFVWQNKTFARVMFAFDDLIVRVFPFLMKYSFSQTVWLQKPAE